MALPPETVVRVLREGDLLGLLFRSGTIPRWYIFRVEQAELPNNLYEHSLGTANAMATAGTDWDLVEDSSSNKLLDPELDHLVHQVFWGVTPSYARVYRQYPSAVDRGSLRGTRTVGGAVGYIDGYASPLQSPSPLTETMVVKGHYPAFNMYHPY